METGESKGSSRATSTRLGRAWALLRNSVLAAVNPRFSTFTYALPLAILVGLLTFGAVVGITVSLMSQCNKSCGLRPVVLLEQEQDPKWYTPLEKAISVSYGAKEPLRDLTCINDAAARVQFDLQSDALPKQLAAGFPATGIGMRSSAAIGSKCSVLHTADCGRKEWVGLYQGLNALANASRGLAANWPAHTAFSTAAADALLQAALSMDNSQGPTPSEGAKLFARAKFPQRIPAMPHCYGASGDIPASCHLALSEGAGGGIIIYQAPPEARCCNVTLRAMDATGYTSRSYNFTYPVYNGTVWTLEVRGRQDKRDSCLEYTGTDYKGDCTAVWAEAHLAVRPPQYMGYNYRPNYAGLYCFFVGMDHVSSVSVCQQVANGSHTCFDYKDDYPPKVDYTQFFDWSGVDCFDPAYPWVTSTINRTTIEEPAFAKFVIQQPFEQQAAAAAGYLLSQLHGYGRWATWYMANASITQNTTTTGDKIMSSQNEVAASWLKANLYCCSCTYPDLLSSLGSALGYSGYIEVVATLVVLLLYLQMVRADNNRLRLSLAALARIAMEQEDKEGDDSGDAAAQKLGPEDDEAAATVTLVKPTAKGAGSDSPQPVQLVSHASTLASQLMEGAQPSPRGARRGPINVRAAGSLPGVAG